jgi:hypothetical protein
MSPLNSFMVKFTDRQTCNISLHFGLTLPLIYTNSPKAKIKLDFKTLHKARHQFTEGAQNFRVIWGFRCVEEKLTLLDYHAASSGNILDSWPLKKWTRQVVPKWWWEFNYYLLRNNEEERSSRTKRLLGVQHWFSYNIKWKDVVLKHWWVNL